MPDAAPGWMQRLVAQWHIKLVALALPGQPPADTIALTTAAWCEALAAAPIAWDAELDAPRIDAAFRRLLPRLDRWPQPKNLLEAMPARAERVKLNAPWRQITDEQRASLRAALAGLRNKMRSTP